MSSFLGGNKKKLCFNLAKHWSVKQIVNTFSRLYESHSNLERVSILMFEVSNETMVLPRCGMEYVSLVLSN